MANLEQLTNKIYKTNKLGLNEQETMALEMTRTNKTETKKLHYFINKKKAA